MLVKRYGTIAVEDLAINAMLKGTRLKNVKA